MAGVPVRSSPTVERCWFHSASRKRRRPNATPAMVAEREDQPHASHVVAEREERPSASHGDGDGGAPAEEASDDRIPRSALPKGTVVFFTRKNPSALWRISSARQATPFISPGAPISPAPLVRAAGSWFIQLRRRHRSHRRSRRRLSLDGRSSSQRPPPGGRSSGRFRKKDKRRTYLLASSASSSPAFSLPSPLASSHSLPRETSHPSNYSTPSRPRPPAKQTQLQVQTKLQPGRLPLPQPDAPIDREAKS